ncbi:MAG TPA: 2-succinyl-6-hydroxy-2,4-cyclohexadiene-1-carboxylate synthase [Prolixibacteraceae bacterium]|nr:MAG: 2-succinyl-6-hydroxy-2,4-cyclohexadiene-1-carboxylate synthase [Bacteroidetes bacterium GWB2_41_8]HCY42849.1 2-succinyl-6-hydroxy-2,4-cyclohexadiene-1-carboxylate synthase [Prolixibacteraceae bacterium]
MIYHRKFLNPKSKTWVVFVHGAGGSNVVWFRQLKEFKKHFNVLLVDLRGHGRSKPSDSEKDSGYSFDEVALDVIRIMDHLEIKKAHLVGISLGCIVIRAIDKLAPGRAESIILGGAVIQFNKTIKVLIGMAKILNSVLPYMWLYKLNALILMPYRKHRESRNIFVQEALKLGEKEFAKWMKMTREIKANLNEFLHREPSAPVLYLMGDGDHMFLPMVADLVKRQINAQLEIIKNSGHCCNLDQANLFNEITIRFIKRNSEKREVLQLN